MVRKITSKLAVLIAFVAVVTLAAPGIAFGHVVVKPNEALTGAYQTFTTSVPNEKDIPTTGVRLLIPDSIESVTPTVKPGWKITTKKSGEKTTEISWTGGTVPTGQRDDFTFSAHLPSTEGDINWKAYQTYQDGSVVSWDQAPSDDGHGSEDERKGPYSVTAIKNSATNETTETQENSSDQVLYVISIAALGLSVLALAKTAKR
jgi:uncharacterized protein YcnI